MVANLLKGTFAATKVLQSSIAFVTAELDKGTA
jgi:hypothetical protein